MRAKYFLVVLLAAVTVAGCARRAPQYQYMTAPVPQAQAYQAPAPVYQPPAVQQPAATQRGFFNQASRYRPAAASYQAPTYRAPMVQAPTAYEPAYTLDAGDRLRISVFGQDGLTNSYAVDAAGYITMPLIGPVPARGLTPEQLSQSITERLRQGYIREPHVTLEIEAYRPFFVLGEVGAPGQYPYVPNMTAETAIAIAGGFGPRADRSKISITRNAGGQSVKGSVPLTYPLRPGDTLRVNERWF
jgi:polysaccharide export outer membrane protein